MPLRVALFTDTFQEINGVALTSRQFVDFARRHDYPLFCVRGAAATMERNEGSVVHHELERSKFSIHLDRGLLYDPVLWRSAKRIAQSVADFKPDIVHVVSPGDVSTVGVYVAKKLNVPLAISCARGGYQRRRPPVHRERGRVWRIRPASRHEANRGTTCSVRSMTVT